MNTSTSSILQTLKQKWVHVTSTLLVLVIIMLTVFLVQQRQDNRSLAQEITPINPIKQIIVNLHPLWSTTGIALTTQEVVDRFQVLQYARGQFQTYVPGYQAGGYQGLSLQYMMGESFSGPPANSNDLYTLNVGQKTLCTPAQKSFAPSQNTVTMDTGAFCQLHDAIINQAPLDHDLNSSTPDQVPTEDIFLHKANGDRAVPLTGSYPDHYMFNPAHAFIQQYFAARLIREITGGQKLDGTDHPATNPDGFELDNISLSWTSVINKFGSLKEYTTSTDYVNAVHQFVTTLRTTLDTNGYSNRSLWGNMISDSNTGSTWNLFADVLAGGMAESFSLSWGKPPSSTGSVERQMTQAESWINAGKYFVAIAQGTENNLPTWGPYSLAVLLMVTDGDHAVYKYKTSKGYKMYYEFPELYYKLGRPLETRRNISSSPVVYERNFECGNAVVNITNLTGTITINDACTLTPSPTIDPNATPTPTLEPTATPLPTAIPTETPTPTPTPLDITAPVVTITYPLNNTTVNVNTNVTITANATDNIGVTQVEFYVNNTLLCTVPTGSVYSCTWRVPKALNVIYTLSARAYDAAGNVSSNAVAVTAVKATNQRSVPSRQ